jgi:hypothetical protein
LHVRKHVLSDLQPYVCTYPDCQLHDHFFETKNDWFRHESHTHRVEWFCNTVSHESFIDVKDFLDHMHTIHSEPLDQAQLLSLHRGFQRPSNAHSGTCTLCGKHASRLKSHLARHLEQLALFAIPQTDYMTALEEDDASSNAARQSAPANSGSHSAGRLSGVSSETSSLSIVEGELGNENDSEVQSAELYERMMHDLSDEGEEDVDTSWDQITPKFKEARDAMDSDGRPRTPALATLASPSSVQPNVIHCPSCSAQFEGVYRQGNYGRHKRQKHTGQKKEFSCEDSTCDKIFYRSDARLKHYRRHHPELAGGYIPRY